MGRWRRRLIEMQKGRLPPSRRKWPQSAPSWCRPAGVTKPPSRYCRGGRERRRGRHQLNLSRSRVSGRPALLVSGQLIDRQDQMARINENFMNGPGGGALTVVGEKRGRRVSDGSQRSASWGANPNAYRLLRARLCLNRTDAPQSCIRSRPETDRPARWAYR